MSTVLIIEDDLAVRVAIADALASEGHETFTADTGPKGLDAGLRRDPDLILLDIVLPEIDGYDVLRRLRADGVEAPVMMISAKGQEIDKVLALELGADDYLTKPFGMAELVARTKAHLRRARQNSGQSMTGVKCIGPIEIDVDARTATCRGEAIELTRTEFDILSLLMGAPGKAFSRDEIVNRVWGHDHFPGSRTLDNHVGQLRRKIGDDPSAPEWIQSVRGVGYRLTKS